MDITYEEAVIQALLLCYNSGPHSSTIEQHWKDLQDILDPSSSIDASQLPVSMGSLSLPREVDVAYHLGYSAMMHLRDAAWSAQLWAYRPPKIMSKHPDEHKAAAYVSSLNHMASCLVSGDWGAPRTKSDVGNLWRLLQINLLKASQMTAIKSGGVPI